MKDLYRDIEELKSKLIIAPNSLVVIRHLAEKYNLASQYKKAIECCDKLVKFGMDIKSAYNNLFYAYDMLEDYDNVLKILKKYLSVNQLVKKPELHKFSHNVWSELHFKNKRAVPQRIVKHMPFNKPSETIDINFSTSFTFSRIGWSERSSEVLKLILEIYPEDIDILNGLGFSFISQKLFKEAKESLDKALLINKKNFRTNLLLGSYYREIGEYRQAEEIFFRLIRNQSYIKFLSGDFSHFLLIGDDAKDFRNLFALLTELGLVYFEGGEYENAIEQFLKVIKFYRNIPSSFKIRSMAGVYLRLGEAYQALGFKRKAFKAFDEALKLDPSSLEALTSVGKMYLEMGRYKRAFDLNEKCLSINPNFDPALKLREKLDQSK